MGENAITLLAQKLKEAEIPAQLQSYFRWITLKAFTANTTVKESILPWQIRKRYGKLILTPVVLQKSETGLNLEIAFRYPVSASEDEVLRRLAQQLPKGASSR